VPKTVYIIAGPNGAGKTTFAKEFLPHFAKCDVFVNADLIATGLSPFDPSAASLQAGRLVLSKIHELADKNKTFGFETTLAGRSYTRLLVALKKKNYDIRLFFLWLPSVELAIKRVSDRVAQGGHDVPETDIRRRYKRGLRNFWSVYGPLVDDWILFQNDTNTPITLMYGQGTDYQVLDEEAWSQIQKVAL